MDGDLECQGRKRLTRFWLAQHNLFRIAHIVAFNCGHIQWRRKVINNGIEHGLNTAVFERRATQNRVGRTSNGQLTDAGFDFWNRNFFTVQELLQKFLIGFSNTLDQGGAVFLGLGLEFLGDLDSFVFSAQGHITFGVTRPNHGLHFNQVNNSGESVLEANR